MATLATTFYKSGATYNQVARQGQFAIYRVQYPQTADPYWQVVVIAPNETYPSMNSAVWPNRMKEYTSLTAARRTYNLWRNGHPAGAI